MAMNGWDKKSKTKQKEIRATAGYVTSYKHGDLFCQARAEKGGQAIVDKYPKDYWVRIRNGEKFKNK